MFEKIKKALKSVVNESAAFFVRLYAVLVSLYVLTVITGVIAISVVFPPIIPLAMAAGVVALAFGAMVHFTLESVVSFFSRTTTSAEGSLASTTSVENNHAHDSISQINTRLRAQSVANPKDVTTMDQPTLARNDGPFFRKAVAATSEEYPAVSISPV